MIECKLTELRKRSIIKTTGKRIIITANYPQKSVDWATFSWFIQVRNNTTQLNVTGDMFLHKATSFVQKRNVQDKGSDGWLQGFLKRYGITQIQRDPMSM
jgi:Tc5 transposase DNA-binding domain